MFSRSAVVYLLLYLVSLSMRNSVFTSASKNVGSELTTLFLAKEASSPRIPCPVSCRMKSASETVMASSVKLLVAIRILRFALVANLVIPIQRYIFKSWPYWTFITFVVLIIIIFQ